MIQDQDAPSPIPGQRETRRPGEWRIRRPLQLLVTAIALVALAVFAARDAGEIGQALVSASRIGPRLVVLAVAAECLSTLLWAVLHRYLLRHVGQQVPIRPMLSMVMVDAAVANTLPGGTGVGDLYNYQWLRRGGAGRSQVAWCLVAVTIASTAALVLLVVLGLVAAGGGRGTGAMAAVVTVLFVVVGGAVAVLSAPGLVARSLHRCRSRSGARPARATVVSRTLATLAARLGEHALGPRGWSEALGLALGNWLTDWVVLVLAAHGLSLHVGWSTVIMAYAVGQIASIIPITPGGLGFVEGGMTAALAVYGVPVDRALAAVLVYRVVSVWSKVPVGWTCWFVTERRWRREASTARTSRAPSDTPGWGEDGEADLGPLAHAPRVSVASAEGGLE